MLTPNTCFRERRISVPVVTPVVMDVSHFIARVMVDTTIEHALKQVVLSAT